MAEFQLAETRAVTLDGSGNAVALGVGPVRYGESWVVTRFSVNSSSKCRLTVHRGFGVDPSTQIDGTDRGDLDTSETNVTLMTGDSLSFKWSKGTAGTTSVVRIEGVKRVVR